MIFVQVTLIRLDRPVQPAQPQVVFVPLDEKQQTHIRQVVDWMASNLPLTADWPTDASGQVTEVPGLKTARLIDDNHPFNDYYDLPDDFEYFASRRVTRYLRIELGFARQ